MRHRSLLRDCTRGPYGYRNARGRGYDPVMIGPDSLPGTPPRSLAELANLHGRVAIITGGAGHLGRSIAAALAELGAAIVLVDVAGDRVASAAERIAAEWRTRVEGLVLDLSDTDAVQTLPGKVAETMGGVDILINNAALVGTTDLQGWATPFGQQSIDTWRRALEVNLTAAFALTQAATPWLGQSGRGTVINIGSIYAVCGPDWRLYDGTPLGNPAAYAASKGGLLQLTRWLATSLAPAIRVNMMSPGGIYRGTPEPFYSRYVGRTPLRRMASEEDFKGAMAFLASDLSSYVTGQHLMVDGGWSAW